MTTPAPDAQGMTGPRITVDGRPHLYFAGTSYHSLHGRREVIEASIDATRTAGLGYLSEHALPGAPPVQRRLDKAARRYLAAEDTVTLASGYLTGFAGLAALDDRFDVVLVDELAHHSVMSAARFTGKPVHRFAHRDADHLGALAVAAGRPLIATDGVFPLRGAIAPIPEYLRIAEASDGCLWIDDAHATGVLGPQGRGSCDHFGVSSPRIHRGFSLSKAIGGFGGMIDGSAAFCESVRRGGVRSAATPPPPAAAAAAAAGFETLLAHPEMIQNLARNAAHLKAGLRRLGLNVDEAPVPIGAWELPTPQQMTALHRALMDKGMIVQYVATYPGVAPHGVLRAVVFSTHTNEDIDRLLETLRALL